MTKTKITPAPWKLVPTTETQRINIFGVKKHFEYHIGTLTSGSKSELDIFRANKNLIVAAPDLLQAAQDVISSWEKGDLAAAVRKLDAAIHKATA